MTKRNKHIPVNTLPPGICEGIMIARMVFDGSPNSNEVERSHRDGGYTFIVQAEGVAHLEIDFKTQHIRAPGLIFIHPDQVHRVLNFEQATIYSWIITVENIRPEYLKLLEDLTPVNFLPLKTHELSVITDAASVCIKLAERKTERLYDAILKESCNTLVALVISQYLAQAKPTESHSRFDTITKAFKLALEKNFTTIKSPAAYADSLNISTPYLNECVKNTTGHPVSYHIQQRIVLEAKRLLYHSNKSVKEIAADLGYDDYSYFTRLFVKVVGMTPIAFRSKNRE